MYGFKGPGYLAVRTIDSTVDSRKLPTVVSVSKSPCLCGDIDTLRQKLLEHKQKGLVPHNLVPSHRLKSKDYINVSVSDCSMSYSAHKTYARIKHYSLRGLERKAPLVPYGPTEMPG